LPAWPGPHGGAGHAPRGAFGFPGQREIPPRDASGGVGGGGTGLAPPPKKNAAIGRDPPSHSDPGRPRRLEGSRYGRFFRQFFLRGGAGPGEAAGSRGIGFPSGFFPRPGQGGGDFLAFLTGARGGGTTAGQKRWPLAPKDRGGGGTYVFRICRPGLYNGRARKTQTTLHVGAGKGAHGPRQTTYQNKTGGIRQGTAARNRFPGAG